MQQENGDKWAGFSGAEQFVPRVSAVDICSITSAACPVLDGTLSFSDPSASKHLPQCQPVLEGELVDELAETGLPQHLDNP